jgi:Flp pilus assembly protein TadG
MKSILRQNRSRRFGRLRRGNRGAVQIEFILSIMVIMFVIFGMWELIMIVHTMNVLSDAAKEGVRYAIVHGSYNTDTYKSGAGTENAVVNYVKNYANLTFHDMSAISVSVTYPDVSGNDPGGNKAGDKVRVEVAYTFVPYTALNLRPTLRAASEGRIVF